VNSNIEHYLRDKTQTMRIDIETGAETFPEFWERIGAEGDLEAALRELAAHHHAGTEPRPTPRRQDGEPRHRSHATTGWRSLLPGRSGRRR
jgi:hypothetical protein